MNLQEKVQKTLNYSPLKLYRIFIYKINAQHKKDNPTKFFR